jgi:hypothetical protein
MIKLLKLKRIGWIALLLAVITAITSFFIFSSLTAKDVKAEEKATLSARQSVYVSSVEEASYMAGFEVATLDSTLIKSMDNEIKYSIDVNQLVQLGTVTAPRPVGQTWELSDGIWIRLFQGPGMKLPNIGESINIGTSVGERVFFEAEDYLPQRVTLY